MTYLAQFFLLSLADELDAEVEIVEAAIVVEAQRARIDDPWEGQRLLAQRDTLIRLARRLRKVAL